MADPAYEPVEQVTPVRPVYTAPVARRGFVGYASLGVRVVLTLVGAAGLVISAFMNWIKDVNGVDLSVRTLWQDNAVQAKTSTFVETIGFAVIVLGLIAIIGLTTRFGWLTRLAGAVAIAGFVLFAIHVYRANLTVSDIQVGAWVALAGGIVAVVAGFFGSPPAVVAPTGPTVVEP
jgi:hypothetical protein